jgi:flagellar hook-basal body complex protein FliE
MTVPIAPIASGIQPISPISAPAGASASSAVTGAGGSFANMLTNAIGNLQDSLTTADNLAVKMAAGDNVDIHDVMIAMEQASIGLQTGLTIRDKAIDAYKEIMSMPL